MEWLAAAEFQYNDKRHAVTGKNLILEDIYRRINL